MSKQNDIVLTTKTTKAFSTTTKSWCNVTNDICAYWRETATERIDVTTGEVLPIFTNAFSFVPSTRLNELLDDQSDETKLIEEFTKTVDVVYLTNEEISTYNHNGINGLSSQTRVNMRHPFNNYEYYLRLENKKIDISNLYILDDVNDMLFHLDGKPVATPILFDIQTYPLTDKDYDLERLMEYLKSVEIVKPFDHCLDDKYNDYKIERENGISYIPFKFIPDSKQMNGIWSYISKKSDNNIKTTLSEATIELDLIGLDQYKIDNTSLHTP